MRQAVLPAGLPVRVKVCIEKHIYQKPRISRANENLFYVFCFLEHIKDINIKLSLNVIGSFVVAFIFFKTTITETFTIYCVIYFQVA